MQEQRLKSVWILGTPWFSLSGRRNDASLAIQRFGPDSAKAQTDPSRKHAYIFLTLLNPHFYIVKLGFTGVYIIFLISGQNIDCGYSLEPPRQGGSNEYPQSMF